jgi:hypothetical protein
MANLWIDGFARYGGQLARMLESGPSQGWAEVGGIINLSTANPRTGTHSIRFTSAAAANVARRIFGAQKNEVYVGLAFLCEALPTSEPTLINSGSGSYLLLGQFRTQGNLNQVSFFLGTDGAIIAARRGDVSGSFTLGTLLGRSDPVIGAGAYQYIEFYVKIGTTDGAIEVRVNEVTVLNLTGINTQQLADAEVSQFALGYRAPGGGPYYFADLYANDTEDDGSGGDTFYGDIKVGTVFPNADTAQADFALSTGSVGFSLINNAPPVDTTFLSAAALARSDFEIQNAPADAVQILTVRPFARVRKADAGAANIRPRMLSGSSLSGGRSSPVTTAFAYYDSNVPLNPATSAPWTPSELDSAILVVERDL